MRKTEEKLPYDPRDPVQFFDMMDQGVLLEMVQYYPVQFKALCILLTLDIQLYSEELQYKPTKKKKKKKSYDNQGKI
jgi:hypothetical protein